MSDALPTPASTLAAGYVRVLVWCKACRHRADADLPALIAAGRGDTPLRELRFQCTRCRSRLTDFVVTGRDRSRDWRGRLPGCASVHGYNTNGPIG
jgi:hypothetical protein